MPQRVIFRVIIRTSSETGTHYRVHPLRQKLLVCLRSFDLIQQKNKTLLGNTTSPLHMTNAAMYFKSSFLFRCEIQDRVRCVCTQVHKLHSEASFGKDTDLVFFFFLQRNFVCQSTPCTVCYGPISSAVHWHHYITIYWPIIYYCIYWALENRAIASFSGVSYDVEGVTYP